MYAGKAIEQKRLNFSCFLLALKEIFSFVSVSFYIFQFPQEFLVTFLWYHKFHLVAMIYKV